MCHCDGETVNHLLLHCNVMSVLWTFVFRSLGYRVLQRRVVEIGLGSILQMFGI